MLSRPMLELPRRLRSPTADTIVFTLTRIMSAEAVAGSTVVPAMICPISPESATLSSVHSYAAMIVAVPWPDETSGVAARARTSPG